jgi:hypothetical protein
MSNSDWTMREARQLSPERHMDSEIEGSPALHNLLEVLEGERGEPSPEGIRSINVHSVQLTVGSPVISRSSAVPEEPNPDVTSDLPAHTDAALSAPANHRTITASPLLKAIVEQISIRFRLIANGPSPFVGC